MISNANRDFKQQPKGPIHRVTKWLSSLTERPLRLRLQGRDLIFRNCREFEFSIGARTAVPAIRIGELLQRSGAELDVEADNLRSLAMRLTGMVEDFEQRGLSISDTLGQTGIMMISKDHDWRQVFTALLDVPDQLQTYVATALRQYIRYLQARQDALKAAAAMRYGQAAAADAPLEAAMAQTMAFDATMAYSVSGNHHRVPASRLRRLPRGQAVMLKLERGRKLAIQLARHRFSLAHDGEWALVGDDGSRYVLKPGVNSVGRSRENNVPVNSQLRNISRRHLLAEPRDRDCIMLTDLSSSGTFVAPTPAC